MERIYLKLPTFSTMVSFFPCGTQSPIILVTALALCQRVDMVSAVVDLNPSQIQYVADHLTHSRCMKLLEALHEKGFWLHAQLGESTTPLPMRQDSDRPCVVQLTRWCNGPGRKMTFEFLALRLKEIGLKQVADTLSRKVLEETSEQLHRFFLDDPFKAMIPTKSVMLDKPPATEKLAPAPDLEDKHENLFVAVVILATASLTFCLCVGICLGCPGLGKSVCQRTCPAICASCCEVALDNCNTMAKGARRSANKYLFVAPKGGGGGAFLV